MIDLDFVLSLVLLTSPPDAPPGLPCVQLHSIQAAAEALELMGSDERRTFFFQESDWRVDLQCVRGRYQSVQFAPPADDLDRFPSQDVCQDCMDVNRRYRSWLVERKALDRSIWLDEAIVECDVSYDLWQLCHSAHMEWCGRVFRREKLQEMRDRIGPVAYYAGAMPPALPVACLHISP